MSDTKISALTALPGANVDTTADLLAIVDTSVTTTKKIVLDEFRTALAASDTKAGTLEVAVQSELETPASVTLAVTPARVRFLPNVAKGWASANASGGINLNHNLTSVTDVDVGSIIFTWFVAFSTAAHCAIVTIQESGATILTGFVGTHDATTTSVVCVTNDASPVVADPDAYFIAVFGDQA